MLDLSGVGIYDLPDDLGRLRHLRVLFCSGNHFDRLPEALGDCAALKQVGFRGCSLRSVPGDALPSRLRWLTLTDNVIAALPRETGERPALQKLMLAGNRLTALPPGAAGESWARVEVRALGLLLGELLDRCDGLGELRALERACTASDARARPAIAEAARALGETKP